jgi:hypothetical protein
MMNFKLELTCGAETWTLTTKERKKEKKNRIQAAENTFLGGANWKRQKKTQIREKLRINSLVDKIENSKIR